MKNRAALYHPALQYLFFSVFISGNIQNILTPLLSQQIDLALQVFQKCACMCAIHLRVMELERDRQVIPEPFLFIPAPDNKGIIENTAVHTNSSVDFRIYDSGRTDDHTVFG